MKVAVLSMGDPMSHSRWSGTPYYIISALRRRGMKVTIVDDKYLLIFVRVLNYIMRALNWNGDWRRSDIFARIGSLYCSLALRARSADVVLSLAAAPYTAYLSTALPVIAVTDATFSGLEELYPQFQDYPQWMSKSARRIDRLCFETSTLVVLPSKWAAKSAIDDYAVPYSKVVVAPFGANLPEDLLNQQPQSREAPHGTVLRLLYVSVDWERKRGDVVVETARLLNRRGVPTKLVVVGNIPRHVVSDDVVEVAGFLRKSNPEELKSLADLFCAAHFFVLPTVGDCSPVVFCEAQAFGCPCITYGVGGTTDAVLHDITGAVLPLGASPEVIADKIQSIIGNPTAYEAMCIASRKQFESQSNWNSFAKSMFEGLDRVARSSICHCHPDVGPPSISAKPSVRR